MSKMELVKVHQPPLYLLDNDESVGYTKNQLQVVQANEAKPTSKAIQPVKSTKGPKSYKVDKIVGRKKEHNRIYYLVKWLGYSDKDNTWELGSKLKKDVPILVQEFEKNNKKK